MVETILPEDVLDYIANIEANVGSLMTEVIDLTLENKRLKRVVAAHKAVSTRRMNQYLAVST